MNTGCRYSVMQATWACDDDDTISVSSDVLVSAIKRNYDRGMQLRYNYRLYPTPGQHAALARAFGCARVVFNDGLVRHEVLHDRVEVKDHHRRAVAAAR